MKQINNPVFDLIYQFWDSAIIRAGIKLDLFTQLSRIQPCTIEKLAEELQTQAIFMPAFMNACCSLQLVKQHKGRYSLSDQAAQFLVKSSSNYMGDLVLHITNHWNIWGNLEERLKSGENMLPYEEGSISIDQYWEDYMKGQRGRAVSGQSANLVEAIDLSNCKKLLDLGGGEGSYSIAFCERYPNLRAVVVDQAEPLALAKKMISDYQLSDRIQLIQDNPGNTLQLDQDFDAALISGVVCINSPAENQKVFKRAFDAVLSDSIVTIQDFFIMPNNQSRKHFDTLMDLYLKITFEKNSHNYREKDIKSWLQTVGYTDIKSHYFESQLHLITAKK